MKASAIIKYLGLSVTTTTALACIVLAHVGSAPKAQAANIHLRQHRPLKVHRWRPDNQVDSENWSGYAVTGASFTQAMGSWVVPTANCSKSPASRSSNVYSSFWVGLDGYTSSTVEQIPTATTAERDPLPLTMRGMNFTRPIPTRSAVLRYLPAIKFRQK
jgi:hypothetical protein